MYTCGLMWTRNLLTAFRSVFSVAVTSREFKEGQVWSYKTRPGEERSRLYIVKVDTWANGEKIFHVYADGLSIKSPISPKGVQEVLPYAPVSKKTLDLSAIKLLEVTQNLPDISEEYSSWKEGAESDDGVGVFTISIAKIISLIEQAANKHAK